jgi:hypothetical protein
MLHSTNYFTRRNFMQGYIVLYEKVEEPTLYAKYVGRKRVNVFIHWQITQNIDEATIVTSEEADSLLENPCRSLIAEGFQVLKKPCGKISELEGGAFIVTR